jgi:Signal transduction histidine kinase
LSQEPETPNHAKDADDEDLRLHSRLRLIFEKKLIETSSGPDNSGDFEQVFSKGYNAYEKIVKQAIKGAFEELYEENPNETNWFKDNKVDIVTWHYKTRHSAYRDTGDPEWLSGQIIFNEKMEGYKGLSPFPKQKSPYIGIFADEKKREDVGMGGPIYIALLGSDSRIPETWWKWESRGLLVPDVVTEELKSFDMHQGGEGPLKEENLECISQKAPEFVQQLIRWMSKARGKDTQKVEAFNFLLASLKVTLKLLKEHNYKPRRSTFLCPAYVAGEEVGGMAFACDDFVLRRTALIGEAISTALLTYLRLREDALAHNIAEQKEKLDQAKRFLIQRLAHDFRHPMESLQSTVTEAKASLTGIEKQISHVNRMMDETIFAMEGRNPEKLLKAKKKLDKVSEFFADIRYFFKGQFKEKGKELEIDVGEPDWVFSIDRGLFHEAMENLISNALEHGGNRVKVSVEKKPGKYLIHVQDNGRGITAKNREGLFTPFYRKPSTKKEGRSRGRGLFITRLLVEAHGGTLELKSADDEWKTHFVIEIPANGS